MTISPSQCRAARALLGLDQISLAAKANVARNTVADFENGKRTPNTNNLKAITQALEAAGVQFIPQNGGGVGVRLANPSASTD